jgi:hypothetical protein
LGDFVNESVKAGFIANGNSLAILNETAIPIGLRAGTAIGGVIEAAEHPALLLCKADSVHCPALDIRLDHEHGVTECALKTISIDVLIRTDIMPDRILAKKAATRVKDLGGELSIRSWVDLVKAMRHHRGSGASGFQAALMARGVTTDGESADHVYAA